jgi:hypothetical protein
MALLLVRHASAGDRHLWEETIACGLDPRGVTQAHDLVALLDRFEIDAIYRAPSSAACRRSSRCRCARLAVDVREDLVSASNMRPAAGSLPARSPTVVVRAGGLETILLDDPPKWRKCGTSSSTSS